MNKKKIVGISIVVLLVVAGMLMLAYRFGAASDSTARIEQLRADKAYLEKQLEDMRTQNAADKAQCDAEHKKDIERREVAHAKEIADKNAEIERRENEYRQMLAEKENKIESLNRTVDHYEGLYRTRTVVYTALGTAVVVALFVGTLMGAKGRRDAMRVRKTHNEPTEEVV